MDLLDRLQRILIFVDKVADEIVYEETEILDPLNPSLLGLTVSGTIPLTPVSSRNTLPPPLSPLLARVACLLTGNTSGQMALPLTMAYPTALLVPPGSPHVAPLRSSTS